MDFETVFKRYSKDVYRFCLSLCKNTTLADDITSETFLKAIKTGGQGVDNHTVKVWLCQIAKNTYYDYLRKHSKITELTEEMPIQSDFELELLDKAESLRIHKLLHQLDEPYKEIFSLRVFSELSFAEIGEIFDKTESWARVTFYRAKLKIRKADING
ncbi:MAG: RNA polymerase sigma factor [Clostridiales bacterium]|nr:RNA polymerase sigma factor [Clostridiales bacterium]